MLGSSHYSPGLTFGTAGWAAAGWENRSVHHVNPVVLLFSHSSKLTSLVLHHLLQMPLSLSPPQWPLFSSLWIGYMNSTWPFNCDLTSHWSFQSLSPWFLALRPLVNQCGIPHPNSELAEVLTSGPALKPTENELNLLGLKRRTGTTMQELLEDGPRLSNPTNCPNEHNCLKRKRSLWSEWGYVFCYPVKIRQALWSCLLIGQNRRDFDTQPET